MRTALNGHKVVVCLAACITAAACSYGKKEHNTPSSPEPAASPSSPPSTADAGRGPAVTGEAHAGQYELGPVAWHDSYTNSCGPYPAEIITLEQDRLAGLGLDFNGGGQLCDACIAIVTDKGRSVLARVVTTGATTAPNNIDVSQSVYDALNQGEYPRLMHWQVAQCPDQGAIRYQFQEGANAWWTSFWVRNIRWPLQKVEVKSTNHHDWTAAVQGSDGSWTIADGFGEGAFSLRLTATGGQIVIDNYSAFSAGGLLVSSGNF